MSGMVEPRIKGVSFHTLRAAFVQLRGQEQFDESLARMPSALSEAYAGKTLLAASWYPLAWYREALTAFRATTHAGPELMRALGRTSMALDMAGTYKHFLVRFLSPQTLLRLSGRLFSTYYDTGRFDVLEARKGMVTGRLSNCLGWNQNMWTQFEGGAAALLEMSGAENVRIRLLSGGKDGDASAELVAYFSEG